MSCCQQVVSNFDVHQGREGSTTKPDVFLLQKRAEPYTSTVPRTIHPLPKEQNELPGYVSSEYDEEILEAYDTGGCLRLTSTFIYASTVINWNTKFDGKGIVPPFFGLKDFEPLGRHLAGA